MTVISIKKREEAINNIHDVLMRDGKFRYDCMLSLGAEYKNKAKVIAFAKRHYHKLHKEAEVIVNDPNRKTVTVYEDELEYLKKEFDEALWEIEGHRNLINDFLDKKNLRNEFIEYLKELKEDEETLANVYFGDIDQHILDFE